MTYRPNASLRRPLALEKCEPPIRLVAIDLDGTLLTDEKRVSDQTLAALSPLEARGVKVVIASARPPRSVRAIYELLQLRTWQINYNGALVWDHPKQEAIYHAPIATELARAMIDRVRGAFPDCLVSCEVLDKWFTDREDNTYTTETGRLFVPDLIAPLEMFLSQPVTKLMFLGPVGMVDEIAAFVRREFPNVAAVRTDPELVQITDGAVSKAAALKRVADAYDVPMDAVMAIGDAMNDLEMLQAAGFAVAVENAHPQVKAAADWIAPSNNNHGVHAALLHFGLA